MNFDIELTKSGKSYILFQNQKFREGYSLKCGVIVWRCLGRSCGASVRTDVGKSRILSTHDKHQGPHPVTMRTLTPPQQRRSSSVAVTPVAEKNPSTTAIALTPKPSVSTTPAVTTALTVPPMSASTAADMSFTPAAFRSPLKDSSPLMTELQADNSKLRAELIERDRLLKSVTDHAIESDTRLLQYTDQIFEANSRPVTPTCSPVPLAIDSAVQCDLPPDVYKDGTKMVDIEGKHISLIKKYNILNEETKNMIISIRSLEGDIVIKNKLISELEEALWIKNEELKKANNDNTALQNKIKKMQLDSSPQIPPPSLLPLGNRFELLQKPIPDYSDFKTVSYRKNPNQNKNHTITNKYKHDNNKRKIKSNFNTRNIQKKKPISKFEIPFSNVSVVGDSHARHLASLMMEQTSPQMKINGFCKPGAGLLSVAPTSTSPPCLKPDCLVLLAGTNDVAAGRQDTIFQHLEGVIKKCAQSSKVLVCSLPPRHDLPLSSPTHDVVSQVNSYIAELCARIRGTELLDIGVIGREHYTSHGLHMRASGKRLLAGIILERMASLPVEQSCPSASERTFVSTRSHALPPGPRTLPFDTYAEAVSRNSPSRRFPTNDSCLDSYALDDKSRFLGKPLQATGLN